MSISSKEMMPVLHLYEMTPKIIVMLMNFYEKMGFDRVSLTDETIRKINVIEDADADHLRQRLLNNFYNLKLSVLVARFIMAEANLNISKASDRIFRNMIEVRHYMFEAIEYWLRERNVEYDSNSLWDELRNLGLCVKVYQIHKKVSDE